MALGVRDMSKILKQLTLASIIAVLTVHSVGAITADEFYSDQDILTYDKNAEAACQATIGDSVNPIATSIEENVKIGYQYFIGKNLSPNQSAGIIGNLIVESGMDPKKSQLGGGPGRGLAQWTSTERWLKVVEFARNQNRSEFDLMLQLDFIWHELQGAEKAAYTHLIGTTTIEQATESFMRKYERPGVEALAERIAAARNTFSKYNGLEGIGGSVSSGGCAGSSVIGGTVVQIAEAEFAKGIVEQPQRCDAGNPSTKGTCGPEIDKYTDSTLEYWCADFVSWIYKTAEMPFSGGASGGWRIASVSSMKDWFSANGQYFSQGDSNYIPKPGDVVFYSYSHVDIIVAINEDTIVTIGGNTGVGDNQNGSGVGKKTKKLSESSIDGFGRMK